MKNALLVHSAGVLGWTRPDRQWGAEGVQPGGAIDARIRPGARRVWPRRPERYLVRDNGRRQGLDPALVFGVIRAESAFHVEARSSAGALGLMQLMPATARITARHAGVVLGGERAILAPPTNVRLGSQYLREMLNRYRGNLAMMAAAYNAGPGRVELWRPKTGCMDAELWVETIPFLETRRYVRKLLFYAAVYEWRMGRPVTTVSARLGKVPARPKGGPQLACTGTPAGVYG